MHFDLQEAARDHVLIAAHRGVSAGNIPCNTIPAYEIALLQGADILETDVSTTADGVPVIFHPRLEAKLLGWEGSIPETNLEEVRRLRYLNNTSRVLTQFGLPTLDEFLETFKDRCYINIDKFWGNPEGIYRTVKRHNMIDQVLVKSPPTEEVLQVLEQIAPEVPYMPVIKEVPHDTHKALMARNINYVGVEVVFAGEDSHLATPEFIKAMHHDGKLVWVNSIIYNVAKQLSGGHSDDTAFTVSMDHGWGWLADRGFDIIQTDWPQMLGDYLKNSGKYRKQGAVSRV